MSFLEPGKLDMILRLRSRGISDTRVLRAMEIVPRSAFIAPGLVPEAYDEKHLPIDCGQSLPAPLTIAILCQTLDVQPADKVLLIGTGSGYLAAVLAQLGTRVYTVERYKALAEQAENRLRDIAPNVVVRHADGRLGWQGQAPFDKIMLAASVRIIPSAIVTQMKTHGRLVAVIGDTLTIAQRKHGRLKETPQMPLSLTRMEPGKSKAL